MRKICGLHDFVQNSYKSFQITWSICHNLVLTVDSALLCSENVWFRSKNARFCSKIFSRLMLEIARWSLEIFLCSKCSTIFPLEIARIENSKSKIVLEIARIENFNARNARDRCFCRSVSTLEKTYFTILFTEFTIVHTAEKEIDATERYLLMALTKRGSRNC